jgi:hypothetical protein
MKVEAVGGNLGGYFDLYLYYFGGGIYSVGMRL